jgi:GTP-binding protein YchF
MRRVGIVGLPNAGKTTLLNALAKAGAATAKHPFTTIEPNVGVVPVPDPRLEALARALRPQKVIPAHIRFVDVAGLVRGASRGEGMGNRFLAHVREVDLVAHVLRAFSDPSVTHVEGEADPVRDREVVETEILLADLEILSRRLEAARRAARAGKREAQEEVALLEQAQEALDRGEPGAIQGPQREALARLGLISMKPTLYVLNVGEEVLSEPGRADRELARVLPPGGVGVWVAGKLEAEAAELPEGEARELLSAYGLKEPALEKFVRACYELLGLVSFFTVESGIVQAWPVPRGTPAPKAAGEIHSDFEKGFIRAEVVRWERLVALGSFHAAREHGEVRSEGRHYVVQDGDVILFRFSP